MLGYKRLRWLPDSSLRAVKLGVFEQFVVASPGHLRRVRLPRIPEDLLDLDWIAMTLLRTPLTWKFSRNQGETQTVHFKAHMRVDLPGVLRSLLQQHAGVPVLDQFNVQEGGARSG